MKAIHAALTHPVVLALSCVGAGCTDDRFTIVTIEGRPALGEVESLEVTLALGGVSQRQAFAVGGRAFPLTFSIQPIGVEGTLSLSATGYDREGTVVAMGTGEAPIDPNADGRATLQLEPADFVANTTVAGDQRLAWDTAESGGQVVVGSDGSFTVGFTDDCGSLGRCDVFGRKFDAFGRPVRMEVASDDSQFTVNQSETFGTDPAMAVGADGGLLVVWSTFGELLAVALSREGVVLTVFETVVAPDAVASGPAVAALPGGDFLVAWSEPNSAGTGEVIKGRILASDGTPAVNGVTGTDEAFLVSTTAGDNVAPAVAASGPSGEAAIVWRSGSALRVRFLGDSGFLTPSSDLLVDTGPVGELGSPRVVGTAAGRYLVAWSHLPTGATTGEAAGLLLAAPTATIVTPTFSIADGLGEKVDRLALAIDGEGSLMLGWSSASGVPTDGKDIYGQLFRATGERLGEPLRLNSTVIGDQEGPSIQPLGGGAWAAAWTDGSGLAPDASGTAIRARILYP